MADDPFLSPGRRLNTHTLNMDVNTDTKPMDSAVPATSPAAATGKKAVAEAAAVTDHPTSASPTRINNVRTARLYTLGTYSPSAPHPTHAPPPAC